MNVLNLREKSLVSLGASIGLNCIPCAIYHIKQCRESKLSHDQIKEAIEAALKIKDISLVKSFRQILA